jgi:hypothetical protein
LCLAEKLMFFVVGARGKRLAVIGKRPVPRSAVKKTDYSDPGKSEDGAYGAMWKISESRHTFIMLRRRNGEASVFEIIQRPDQIQKDISSAAWAHVGRSTVGFIRARDDPPSSLGSGTLIRFGNIFGVLSCAHVLEALQKEAEIGILCFPVRAAQIQTLRLPMDATDGIAIGSAPWDARGPDLAFLRLPAAMIGDIKRVATIANGDRHRQNILAGQPTPARRFCAVAGVVDEWTKPPIITPIASGIAATTPFEALINVGHLFVDDESVDRFRLQPVPGEGMTLPKSYKGMSGGGLWKFFLGQHDFSIVQVRLIGVAYWEKPLGDELHILGHGQTSIYETLFNAIRQKWP